MKERIKQKWWEQRKSASALLQNLQPHTNTHVTVLKLLMLFWWSHSSAKFMSNNNLLDDKIQTLSHTTERSLCVFLRECQSTMRKKERGKMNISMLLGWQTEFPLCHCKVPPPSVQVKACFQSKTRTSLYSVQGLRKSNAYHKMIWRH